MRGKRKRDLLADLPPTLNKIQLSAVLEWIRREEKNEAPLDIKNSNGLSAVIIPDDYPVVYHYFQDNIVFKRICTMFIALLQNQIVTLPISIKTGFGKRAQVKLDRTLVYNIFDYVSRFEYCLDGLKTIVWGSLTPLNALKNLKRFVKQNILKIAYDCSKGIYALHSKGYKHSDCRIDNIGVNLIGDEKENFVLFDFDGSSPLEGVYKKDYNDLAVSIQFVTEEKLPFSSVEIRDLIEYVVKKDGVSYEEALNILENETVDWSSQLSKN